MYRISKLSKIKKILIRAVDHKICCFKTECDLLILETAQNVSKINKIISKQISKLY